MRRLAPYLLVTLAAPAACAEESAVDAASGDILVESLASGLEHPWGMAFLPDGRLLVTERAGHLRILDTEHRLSEPLAGTPSVFARGQGGLLDVALHPDFAANDFVYLSYAEPGDAGASTALGRGRLIDGRIEDFEVLFSQQPKVAGENHFGGRIVFADDDTLFLTTGERYQFDPAQDLSVHLGKLIRLQADGGIPQDNPFVDEDAARDAIWSYGHRNVESAAIDPASGALWIAEMGPQGGDELNRPEAGRNYGWPVVSWGEHYDGTDIADPPTHPQFADAAIHWTPVISPSGMTFYDGEAFTDWRGSMLIGGLTSQGLVRVEVEGDSAREVERIDLGARIRDVEQGPDGAIYVLTDQPDGSIWRLHPAS